MTVFGLEVRREIDLSVGCVYDIRGQFVKGVTRAEFQLMFRTRVIVNVRLQREVADAGIYIKSKGFLPSRQSEIVVVADQRYVGKLFIAPQVIPSYGTCSIAVRKLK